MNKLFKSAPPVRKVMTPFPYAVERSAQLGEARRLMLEHDVHHLPVVEGHALVGVISDRDIKLFLGPELGSPDPREAVVADAYQSEAYAVELDTPIDTVAREMLRRRIGSALVTRNGKLAGLFTVTDACRFIADLYDLGEPLPDEVA